jgi:hypothetical protein
MFPVEPLSFHLVWNTMKKHEQKQIFLQAICDEEQMNTLIPKTFGMILLVVKTYERHCENRYEPPMISVN